MKDSNINMMRGDLLFRNITLETYIQMGSKIEEFVKMNKDVKEFKVIERHPDGRPKIYYTLSKLPFMSDRENLIEAQMIHVNDK